MKGLASMATAVLFLALSASQVLAIDNEERKELMRRLGESAPVDINFNNAGGAPVQLIEAKVKRVRRDEQQWTKNGEAVLSDYAMWARLRLENTKTQQAKLVCLKFIDAEANNVFYASYPVERQKNPLILIQLMIVTGDPSRLAVEVAAVLFEDDSAWKDIGFPQKGSKESRKAQSEDADFKAKAMAAVTTKPKLLTNPVSPTYTTDARRNRVQGSVRLRLLIGEDGAVKQISVANALPDGLTEKAIHIAYQMKFTPATKGGVAVEVWNVAQIEFNIR